MVRRIALFGGILITISSLAIAQTGRPRGVPAFRPERHEAQIEATVISVKQLVFPEAELTLRVTSCQGDDFFKKQGWPEKPLIARPLYDRRDGAILVGEIVPPLVSKVIPASKRNVTNAAGYYLLPGDRISAKALYLIVDEWRHGWYVDEIKRKAVGTMSSGREEIVTTLRYEQPEPGSGAGARLTLTIRNAGSTAKKWTFPSSQQADFAAYDESGREVWRWSHGRAFLSVITTLTLAPGQRKEYRVTWDRTGNDGKPLPPGKYSLVGWLTAREGAPRSAPVVIVLKDAQ